DSPASSAPAGNPDRQARVPAGPSACANTLAFSAQKQYILKQDEAAVAQTSAVGREAKESRAQAEGRKGARVSRRTAEVRAVDASPRDIAGEDRLADPAQLEAIHRHPPLLRSRARAIRNADRGVQRVGKSPALDRRSGQQRVAHARNAGP